MTHWTERSVDDYLYRIATDFVVQLESKIQSGTLRHAQLAQKLGVSKGRVSQILNNPGNLTLKMIIKCARALGMKIAIVAYDDDDYNNEHGPINSEIFRVCWEKCGKPADFWSLSESQRVASTATLSRASGTWATFVCTHHRSRTSQGWHLDPGSSGIAEWATGVYRTVNQIGELKDEKILVTFTMSPSSAPVFQKINASIADEASVMCGPAIVYRDYDSRRTDRDWAHSVVLDFGNIASNAISGQGSGHTFH